jgi:hypothetical protein
MPGPEPLEFALIGRPLRARLRTPALRDWLVDRWQFDGHEVAPHPYRITIDEESHPPADLPAPHAGAGVAGAEAVVAELPGIRLHWWHQEPWWWMGAEGGVAIRFDPDEARIRVWNAGAAPPDLTAALYLALNEALRASGLIPLHAAVVINGSDAVAIVAPSGTGKTTTLLRLLSAGWAPLAEDLSWLDPESFTLYGWDRGIRLWPPSLETFFPHLASAPWRPDPDGKLFLDYDALGAPRVPQARLTRIIRLARQTNDRLANADPLAPRPTTEPTPPQGDQPGASLTRLSSGESVRVFWEATGVPMLPATRAALAGRLPEILKAIPFWRLELPDGPAPLPSLLPPPDSGS